MSHKNNSLLVEVKVLQELQRGSYEELLQEVDRLVSESTDLFGGDAVLFSTYKDHAIVVNEGGEFYRAWFTSDDGIYRFGDVDKIGVNTISESDVFSGGVESFFNGGSLMGGFLG